MNGPILNGRTAYRRVARGLGLAGTLVHDPYDTPWRITAVRGALETARNLFRVIPLNHIVSRIAWVVTVCQVIV